MLVDEIIATLQEYEQELGAILMRFTRTRERVEIESQDNFRLRALTTELIDLLRDHVPGSAQHIRQIANAYNEGYRNFYQSSSYASVQEIRGVTTAVLKRVNRNPTLFAKAKLQSEGNADEGKLLNAVDNIISRFHAVATQIRKRHGERDTLDIYDEYDVQDLMHALLRLHFDDIRPEEWVPSYAGSASRTDFLLPQIDTIIEIKKTRVGLGAKAVGEQLIIDIAKYKRHPQCRRLICFVYDPEGRVSNPAGIEKDLNTSDHGIDVNVYILPKTA